MKKQISPAFAALVVIVALVLGALYFLVQYRGSEARLAMEKAALQQQADQARASGRRGQMTSRRSQRQRLPSAPPGSQEEPGAPAQGE
jgi:hypothetical protein